VVQGAFLGDSGRRNRSGRRFAVEMHLLIGRGRQKKPEPYPSQLPLRSVPAVALFVSIACLSWPCGLPGGGRSAYKVTPQPLIAP
jgi:hypothetical protein